MCSFHEFISDFRSCFVCALNRSIDRNDYLLSEALRLQNDANICTFINLSLHKMNITEIVVAPFYMRLLCVCISVCVDSLRLKINGAPLFSMSLINIPQQNPIQFA